MSSRKDLIKRSLGITEYPWSSDDELEAATQAVQETSLRRPPAELRPSTTDAPGPSVPPPPMSQQQFRQIQHQHSQQQDHLQQQASSRRSQARQNRDLFWSIINSPYRISSQSSRPRPNEVSIPRIPHVPAAGASGSGEGSRRGARVPAEMQRIMEFKRLTRNLGSLRHRSYLTGVIPVSRGIVNPGVIVPSEANSSIIINRHRLLPARARARTAPAPATSTTPRNDREGPPSPISARRWEEMRLHAARPLAPEPPPEPPRALHHSDEDVNNNPAPPPSHPEGHRLSTLDETNEEPDASMEEVEVVDLGLNANVTLEEEIVAIDLDNNDVANQISAPEEEEGRAVTSAPAEMSDETDGRFLSDIRLPAAGDSAVASTSAPSGDAAPGQSNRAVKRKCRDPDESLEPGTVKEFNQNLLRLLECPVCLEWMEPPMSQCRRGHLVCGRCRARLVSCPVCRTTFSSVRNRAMEGVAELVRYPCRHGCGREVRLRRRAPHEASCAARSYHCPAPLCADAAPLPRASLAHHFQSHHLTMMKIGRRHKFTMKVNSEQHDNWLILAMGEYFHLKIDVDIRTWGIVVYVSYIGPKCDAKNYTYEVTIDGQHNQRKLVYSRTTHSDLESSTLNVSRQDCFHLTLDQALNFIRFKNRHCDADKFLEFNLEITKLEQPATALDESDS